MVFSPPVVCFPISVAAQKLNVSTSTLRRWVKSNSITYHWVPGTRGNKIIKFTEADIERILKHNCGNLELCQLCSLLKAKRNGEAENGEPKKMESGAQPAERHLDRQLPDAQPETNHQDFGETH